MDAKLRAIMLSVMMMLCLTILPSGSTVDGESENQAPICNAERNGTWTMGLISCTNATSPGYTLFSPMPSTTSYLIDQHGREVHSWESPGAHRPGLSSYMLDNGDLLRTANIAQQAVGNFSGGGTAGKIERISWNGTAEWSWEYSSMDYITHHDIEPMPNGNILAIAWEDKSEAEALQAGRNPAIASDAPGGNANVWPDHIIEIEPLANNQANIVWEWHAWDHLIQDYDPSVDNYGVVSEHPELLDINFVGATGNQAGRADWMHCNGIDYNAELDQIALSCKNTNEFYIIDHSTTTAEAAGHTGGNSGKGGDFLYRWGNPQAYDGGLSSDQQLFGQHDVQWIEEGREGAGDFMVFNNGNGRSPGYSSVDVIQSVYVDGNYPLQSNGTWGPNASHWSWGLNEDMYAQFVSGAERLPNGNTLVTFGTQGTLYEVDLNGERVWEYINPVTNQGILSQGDQIPEGNNSGTTANAIFKVKRYALDAPAFSNKNLTPGDYIETWIDLCPNEESLPWDIDGDGCIDDSDGDSVHDPDDECWGFDDSLDLDNDSISDGCDPFVDSDFDGIDDSIDSCLGFNDLLDMDNDSIPDGCDDLDDRTMTANYSVKTTYESSGETVESGLLHIQIEFTQLLFTPGTTIEYSLGYGLTTIELNVSSGELEMVVNGSNSTLRFEVNIENAGAYCIEVHLRLPNNQSIVNQNESGSVDCNIILEEESPTTGNELGPDDQIIVRNLDGDCIEIQTFDGVMPCFETNQTATQSDSETNDSLDLAIPGIVLLTALFIGLWILRKKRTGY